MVMIADAGAGCRYEVYDAAGQHLGRVLESDGPPPLGRGAATVFLQRSAGAPPLGR
jgi:hypothetical protein